MHIDTKILFWKHFPIIDQDPKQLIDATLKFQEKVQCDIIKIPMPGTWQAVSYGAVDQIWEGDDLGRRFISKPIIQQPNDWLNLKDFSLHESDTLNKMCRVTNAVKMRSKNEEVWATVFNPISIAIQLSGLDTFKNHCKIAPDIVRNGLNRISSNNLFSLKKFNDNGADGIYFVSQYMQKNYLPSPIYVELGKDGDKQCIDACKIFDSTLFHIHGTSIDPIFDDIPEGIMIHFENSSYNRSKIFRMMKEEKNLIPGIPACDIQNIDSGELIHNYLSDYRKNFPDNRLFTSGCVLPYDIPDKQIIKWIEKIKNPI